MWCSCSNPVLPPLSLSYFTFPCPSSSFPSFLTSLLHIYLFFLFSFLAPHFTVLVVFLHLSSLILCFCVCFPPPSHLPIVYEFRPPLVSFLHSSFPSISISSFSVVYTLTFTFPLYFSHPFHFTYLLRLLFLSIFIPIPLSSPTVNLPLYNSPPSTIFLCLLQLTCTSLSFLSSSTSPLPLVMLPLPPTTSLQGPVWQRSGAVTHLLDTNQSLGLHR